MLDGKVQTDRGINLLYHEVERHYHVTVNIKIAMANTYVCKELNKGCRRTWHINANKSVVVCVAVTPCLSADVRIPCESWTENLGVGVVLIIIKNNLRGKTIFEQKRNWVSCGSLLLVNKKHKCLLTKNFKNVLNRAVRTVSITIGLEISVVWWL